MSINNISTVNLNNLPVDTRAYFNNFYQPALTVSQDVDDAILGYFEQVADTKESARALAGAVVATSIAQGIDPMTTLDNFKSITAGELNSYLATFLNFNRIGTSYLGISTSPTPNKYVARSILP
jgi:hypothetical protein